MASRLQTNSVARSVLLVDPGGSGEPVPANETYHVHVVRTIAEVAQSLSMDGNTDLVLVNMRHSPQCGLDVLEQVRRIRPSASVIMLASAVDPYYVVRAVRLGADDCVATPRDVNEIEALIDAWIRPRPEASCKGEELYDTINDDRVFIAVSPKMRQLREQIRQLAQVDVPVLCLGESGSGKEVVARLIHKWSCRSKGVFLKVNCAALPSELLESELFGYERGAFTGAERSKPGRFEQGNNGTILLDEIAEMPFSLQAKLLHVLQDHEFTRLGGRSRIRVNVRVVAATNMDIEQAIASKAFREDVYYRVSTFIFRIPPLRERKEDIPVLLQRSMRYYAAMHGLPERLITSEVLERCRRHAWPGNVRELENFARRYLILGDPEPAGGCDAAVDLATSKSVDGCSGGRGSLQLRLRDLKEAAESVAIRRALNKTNWNRKAAAELLNISYKSLLGKIRRHGIGNPTEAATGFRTLALGGADDLRHNLEDASIAAGA